MTENELEQKKTPFYKKVIGISIMVAVAVYCVPELREKFISATNFLKSEWRKIR